MQILLGQNEAKNQLNQADTTEVTRHWTRSGRVAPRPISLAPGTRVFGGKCWDLEKKGAAECALRPAANPGTRIFGCFCWDLDEE